MKNFKDSGSPKYFTSQINSIEQNGDLVVEFNTEMMDQSSMNIS